MSNHSIYLFGDKYLFEAMDNWTANDFNLKELEIHAAASRVLCDFLLNNAEKLDLLKRALGLLLFHPESWYKVQLRGQLEERVKQLQNIVEIEYQSVYHK